MWSQPVRTGMTEEAEEESNHLDDVKDGAGCTEIWESLSAKRKENESTEDQ